MINKLYSKVKQFIIENIAYIIILISLVTVFNLPVPYYIETSGGIINLEDKIIVNNNYKSKGTFNLTYVSQMEGNVLSYLVSKFNDEWDLVKKETSDSKLDENKTFRNKILLDNSLNNALFVAYTSLNKEINIKNSNIYVLYIDEFANTDLKVGDIIKEVNNIKLNSINDYKEVLKNSKIGDILKLKVLNNKKEYERYVEVRSSNGGKSTYIYIVCNYLYDVSDVIFNFDKNESGSSGGFMIALSIYDSLTPTDLTKGLTIAGTGTIDIDGNVGEIDGIKYKIKGAVNNNADVFLVPVNNYEEAVKEVDKNNYDIKLIKIKTFNDAIKYLSE